MSLILGVSGAYAQDSPEASLRLLRDGRTPDWGAPEAELRALFRQSTASALEAEVLTEVPAALRGEVDWRTRLGVPDVQNVPGWPDAGNGPNGRNGPNEVEVLDGISYWVDGPALWRSDGSRLGTYRVARLPSLRFKTERSAKRLGDRLYILSRADPDQVVLLSWDGVELSELRRWDPPAESGAASASFISRAGGYLWFGVFSNEGDALYRVGPSGRIDEVRDLSDPQRTHLSFADDFAGVFELDKGLVALEAWRASFIRAPGESAPTFEDITAGSGFRLRSFARSLYDDTLWFAMDESVQTLAYRVDGSRDGTRFTSGPVRLGGIVDAYRSDRWLEFSSGTGLRLRDEAGRPIAELDYGTDVFPTPAALVTREQILGEDDVPGGTTQQGWRVRRVDLEDGAIEELVSSTSGVPRWWAAADGAAVLERPRTEGPPGLQVLGPGDRALSDPVDLRIRRRPVDETALVATAGPRGLIASRIDRNLFGGELEWFDRRTGVRRLRADAQFVGVVGEAALFLTRGQPVGAGLFRFDPARSDEPELIRAFARPPEVQVVGNRVLVTRTPPGAGSLELLDLDLETGEPTRLAPPDGAGNRTLVFGADRVFSWTFGAPNRLEEWRLTEDGWAAPSTVIETELDVGPRDLLAVDGVVWGFNLNFVGPARERRFYRLRPGLDPERPALVLPEASRTDAFRVWTPGRTQGRTQRPAPRAFVQVDSTLVQLTRDEAFVVEGLPSDIVSVVVTQAGAYVVADGLAHGPEAYRVSSRPGRPAELIEIAPGPAGAYPSGFTTAFGGHVFLADDGTHGRELWFDDGQTVRMICDFVPGPISGAEPRGLVSDEDGIYLRVDTGARGQAVWRVAREVVLGQTPCPEVEALRPAEFGPRDEVGRGLQTGGGGCRGTPVSGVSLLLLFLGGLWVRRACGPRSLPR